MRPPLPRTRRPLPAETMKRLLILHLSLTALTAAVLAVAAATGHAEGAPAPAPASAPVAGVGTASPPAAVPLPRLRGEYQAPRLVLSGTLPDEAERGALLARARAVYGAAHVVDRMEVAPVANPAWLSPAFLPDLRGVRQATLVLEDGRLVVEGIASSPQAFTALSASLERLRGQGLAVENRLRAPAR